jgi:formylglycine-generating enzyme required for sulfatase activity
VRWSSAVVVIAGCHLSSNGAKKAPGPTADCALPAEPSLLGIAPELRNRVADAARDRIVILRHHLDRKAGCRVVLEVAPCRTRLAYRYVADPARRTVIVDSEPGLAKLLPLSGPGLVRALHDHEALRVDEEIAGRFEVPNTFRPTRRGLEGDCKDATHAVIGIDAGGASIVAGARSLIGRDRSWFLDPPPGEVPVVVQVVGRPQRCRAAEKSGRPTDGCDQPLRVRIVPLTEEEPPKEIERTVIRFDAGAFDMGSARSKRGDGPIHRVELSAFEIDATEVTVGAYFACIGAGACTPPSTGRFCGVEEQLPRNCVTWKQADAYCRYAGMRLPTEAEWERAARGTDRRRFVWGDEWPPPRGAGNLADDTMRGSEPGWLSISSYDDGAAYLAPARASSPTADGVFDMAGNVMEWVADAYDERAYETSPKKNPKGPSSGLARVVRGGSFGTFAAEALEVTHRGFYVEDRASAHIGFRCAK